MAAVPLGDKKQRAGIVRMQRRVDGRGTGHGNRRRGQPGIAVGVVWVVDVEVLAPQIAVKPSPRA